MSADGANARTAPRRRKRRGVLLFMLLAMASLASGFLALRQGWLPSLVPPLDLAAPDHWMIDWRLSRLARDRAACSATLQPPYIEATGIADKPIVDGCGWINAVRVTTIAGVRMPVDKVSCQTAAGLALWLRHDLQPLAVRIFGHRIAAIRHLGSYACRNVAGNPLFKHWRSAHATANAIDIAAFTLTDGRQIVIDRHWKTAGKEAEFLRAAIKSACRYFHVAIGPAYNAAHHDHFHLDRGVGTACS